MGNYSKVIRETAKSMEKEIEEYKSLGMDKKENIRNRLKENVLRKITKPVGNEIMEFEDDLRDFFNSVMRK